MTPSRVKKYTSMSVSCYTLTAHLCEHLLWTKLLASIFKISATCYWTPSRHLDDMAHHYYRPRRNSKHYFRRLRNDRPIHTYLQDDRVKEIPNQSLSHTSVGDPEKATTNQGKEIIRNTKCRNITSTISSDKAVTAAWESMWGDGMDTRQWRYAGTVQAQSETLHQMVLEDGQKCNTNNT